MSGYSPPSSGGVLPTEYFPADTDYLAWNMAPDQCCVNGSALSVGVVSLHAVMLRAATLVSRIFISIATVANTPTAGQNFLGIYNSTGTLVGTTADMTAAFGVSGVAVVNAPLVTPVVLPAGQYWVAMLANGVAGPILRGPQGNNSGASIAAANALLPASRYRVASQLAGQTVLPANITPANNVANSVSMSWVALG